MILNKSQALAVYNAMCELNNVSGLVRATLENGAITVCELEDGSISVSRIRPPAGLPFSGPQYETYASQGAFAAAYDIP